MTDTETEASPVLILDKGSFSQVSSCDVILSPYTYAEPTPAQTEAD